jgi:hypothetical protein
MVYIYIYFKINNKGLGAGSATPKGQPSNFFFLWPFGVAETILWPNEGGLATPRLLRVILQVGAENKSHPMAKIGWLGIPKF